MNPISQYFRCFDLDFELTGQLSSDSGFFRFGPDVVCYGRSATGFRSAQVTPSLYDAWNDVVEDPLGSKLPFDPAEIVENLCNERYIPGAKQVDASNSSRLVQAAYYLIRPFLTLSVRKHLQKIHLRDWRSIPFPQWPVDRTVDVLMEKLLILAARNQGLEKIPFIWFWPDGANACSVMTHDVEAEPGREFCTELMSINERFSIPASFQVVPEKRYKIPAGYLEEIKKRGFEVNVQDLDHDGRLFRNHKEFLRRAAKINRYAQEFGAKGFRSAILYRNQDWFNQLQFSYDMSVPNVAHLDPQRGGCCTVMPYFIGDMLELPVTTTQDHTLFNVLNDYSLSLWKQQSELIMEQHGLLGFIVHPDYIISSRPQATYKLLLEYLVQLRAEKNVWIALPGEVDLWWRQRSKMTIVNRQGKLSVEGSGHEKARIAYAWVDGNRIVYELSDTPRLSAKSQAAKTTAKPAV
jgi:hypothetical protein